MCSCQDVDAGPAKKHASCRNHIHAECITTDVILSVDASSQSLRLIRVFRERKECCVLPAAVTITKVLVLLSLESRESQCHYH